MFITSATSPLSIESTAVNSPLGPKPSEYLRITLLFIPSSARNFAVPAVATISKPNLASALTESTHLLLSRSAKDAKTAPDVGKAPSAPL
ncbi:unannotated protein [freshwater metagenome]|uniref:Unannotated protein n=1 Tax=freshwater metagenome TaxID=449393 RepID=A0A6J7SAY4_9ZZZZ